MKTRSFALVAVLLSCIAAAQPKKYSPDGSPTRAIQELDDMLDAYVLHPKTDEEKQRNLELKRKILNGTFDIRDLCRFALDKHWKEISAKDQDSFVDLMTRLLEKKAVFSKEQEAGKSSSKTVYFVTYEGEKYLNSEKTRAFVHTFVQIPSEKMKIGLDYKLSKASDHWKIYDVMVDEASLAENYKYQFDRIISQHGFPDLVHRMESKLKELDQPSISQ